MKLKQKIKAIFALPFIAFVFGCIFAIWLKIALNIPFRANYVGVLLWGGAFFIIVGFRMLFSYEGEYKKRPSNLKMAHGGGYSTLNALIQSMQPVKVNGNATFLKAINGLTGGVISYSEPKKEPVKINKLRIAQAVQIPLVYFSSVDSNGFAIQIPEDILRRLLKFAENNRRYGKGLSERGLTSKTYKYVLGNEYLYWPIMNLLFAVEKETKLWIKPNGIEVVRVLNNNWNILMPSASVVYRLCVIYNFGDGINEGDLKRVLGGVQRDLMKPPTP